MASPRKSAVGITFQCVRLMQAASLIAVIGMTSNFVSDIISAKETAPSVLVGALSVACVAVIYCAITFLLFLDSILPLLINTAMDSLFLISLVVVTVTVGKPLSYLDCPAIESSSSLVPALDLLTSLNTNSAQIGGEVDFNNWVGTSKTICLEIKAIWGLSISLCVLFAFSAICTLCLWWIARKPKATAPKDLES